MARFRVEETRAMLRRSFDPVHSERTLMSAARKSHGYLGGTRIDPPAITGRETAAELIDSAFLAYNAARLREGARLLTERMLQDDVTVQDEHVVDGVGYCRGCCHRS